MYRTRWIAILAVALLTAGLAGSAPGAGPKLGAASTSVGRWEKLPLPDLPDLQVCDMAMEPGGTVWILASQGLFYWDGSSFRPAAGGGDRFVGTMYLTHLLGGADRGLYVTQPGTKDHWGKVYALSDGTACDVADFYYDEAGEPPGLYVSKSGRLYNWGKRFLAVHSGNEWTKIEARLSGHYTLVFETARGVHFYYNARLYSADAKGDISSCDVPCPFESVPGSRRIHGALWGDTRMLLLDYDHQGVYAYDLEARAPVRTDSVNAALGGRDVYDVFRTGDGSVWVLSFDPAVRSYVFVRVSPSGETTPMSETAELPWENTRCWQFPGSVLDASDGSIWFGLPRGGVARYRNGALRIFGWKDGVRLGSALHLCEDPRGTIYAASPEAVYVFRPGQPPAQPEIAAALWEEYLLASSRPIRDSDGNVWMFLKDHPGQVSRWDGHAWRHAPVPFDTSKVGRAMADDRGHILAEVSEPTRCFDLAPESLGEYPNLESMLTAAAADGARRFETHRDFQGCYVLAGGKIWYGVNGEHGFRHFDGAVWDGFGMRNDIDYMYESARYGVIVHERAGRYYAYDRRQIVEAEYPRDAARWILGPKKLQPFEPELLATHPETYAPVERDRDGKYYLLYPADGISTASGEPVYQRGDPLPQYLDTLSRSLVGGYWTDYGSSGPYRIFAGKVFRCDFSESPLAGQEHDIRSVIEDRARNLWIDAGWYAGARHVFLRRLSDFRIRVDNVPAKVKGSLRLTAEPLLPGLEASGLRVFWRFGGQPWRGGEPGPKVTIAFPASGEYQVELVGMDPMGGTSEPLTLAISAIVPIPETRLARDGPYTVNDVVWQAPAEAVPSESGAVAELAYRIDGGEWKTAREGKVITGGLEAGEHLIEIASQEGEHRDPTPLRLTVTYAPDFALIVESRLDIIAGPDADRARAALDEIRTAGPAVLPVLRERLAEARKAARLTAPLEQLLGALEDGNPR